jgi:hypothetical protein
MNALEYIKGLMGLTEDEDETDGLEALQNYLAKQEERLSLTAVFARPTIDTQGEPTAVFPVTLLHDGEEYAPHTKEFPIPDDGLDDESAALTQFLAEYGIESTENLGEMQGETASATLKDNGEVEVTN